MSAGLAGVAGARAAITPPTPTFAKTVVLTPIRGTVSILRPGAHGLFRVIVTSTVVPVGTMVDTTAGRVKLTSADPGRTPAKLQTGQFFRGVFQVRQDRRAGGLVNLVIRDNLNRSVCGASAARAAAVNRRVLGLLRGTAKGRFRTAGRFAAATVRGTDWGVRDRCDGTLTVVRRGVVVVRDFRLHKTVTVRAGQTYLAKAS
ncbi:MAG TPA: hypothetical protein VJU80_14540 [Solirubrobacteraceae bacterium]|nr:hypothetical protein [Solirubrobacteraceae bacterium]